MSVIIKFFTLSIATLIVILDVALFVLCKEDTFNKTGLKVFYLKTTFYR